MSVLWAPGEAITAEEGAPAGPSFDLHVPSQSDPDRVYLIVRDEVTNVLVHQPPCTAWRHGNHRCAHVRAAIMRSEQPASVFLEVVGRLFDSTTWWAEGEVPPVAKRLISETKAALDEARAQITRNAAGAKARASSDAFNAQPLEQRGDQAIAELGGVQ